MEHSGTKSLKTKNIHEKNWAETQPTSFNTEKTRMTKRPGSRGCPRPVPSTLHTPPFSRKTDDPRPQEVRKMMTQPGNQSQKDDFLLALKKTHQNMCAKKKKSRLVPFNSFYNDCNKCARQQVIYAIPIFSFISPK